MKVGDALRMLQNDVGTSRSPHRRGRRLSALRRATPLHPGGSASRHRFPLPRQGVFDDLLQPVQTRPPAKLAALARRSGDARGRSAQTAVVRLVADARWMCVRHLASACENRPRPRCFMRVCADVNRPTAQYSCGFPPVLRPRPDAVWKSGYANRTWIAHKRFVPASATG